jgi:hypothetical protein
LLGDIHIQFQKDHHDAGNDEEKKKAALETFNNTKAGATKFYTDEQYFYAPIKTANGLKFAIDHLQKIMATTCGSKLKKLAKIS